MDCTRAEERCDGACVSVGVTPHGSVCGLAKDGKLGVDTTTLEKMIEVWVVDQSNECVNERIKMRIVLSNKHEDNAFFLLDEHSIFFTSFLHSFPLFI